MAILMIVTQSAIALVCDDIVGISAVTSEGSQYFVNGGLSHQYNDKVYGDREYNFSHIPAPLNCADYVLTLNDDKFSTGEDFLRLTIYDWYNYSSEDSLTVYVAYDDRYTEKPDWMETFIDSRMDLIFDSVTLSLYYKKYSVTPGQDKEILLGGNFVSGQGNYGMYGVVLVWGDGGWLRSGSPVSGIVINNEYSTNWQYYQISTSEFDVELLVELYNLSDDIDLYVKKGDRPSETDYDCRSYRSNTTSETCTLSNVEATTWHIGVKAYEGTAQDTEANYALKATVFRDLVSSPATGSVAVGEWIYYRLPVSDTDTQLFVQLSGLSADADLYVKKNELPSSSAYDCRSYSNGTQTETCTLDNSGAGTWYLGVYGYQDAYYSLQSITSGSYRTTDTPRLVNISTRCHIQSSPDNAVAGFIIDGTGTKKVLVRAIRSAAESNLGFDLKVELLQLNGGTASVVESNDDWQNGPDAAAISALAANLIPGSGYDAALIADLPAGVYTAIASPLSGSGIGVVGVDDLDTSPTTRLLNISGRCKVESGIGNAVAGFIISGDNGSLPILLRGFKSAAESGIFDPAMDFYQLTGSTAQLLDSNDSWQTHTRSSEVAGLAANYIPQNSTDTAMMQNLGAGVYTINVKPNSNAGIGVVGVDLIQ